ncbi:flagellin [Mucispirillum schaedleri]|uniref:flagellin N-terminal helical domain-containing protein n=1 Tax=Mucispirillum schaedleri TaxID=248039 RepID=UPI001F589EF6|nr:flagellin [Mucispirillum schaedleri]
MSTGMITNSNLFSLSSLVAAGRNQSDLSQSINRLSSGLRINTFMDDPSRMAISEKMRGFILGLQTSSQNAQDGISYLQTAEGAANEVSNMLQRMRELAVEGANGVYSANDRLEIQKEIDQLKEEIDRISETTQFNTKKLINGESSGAWNSGTDKISAVINGTVADGNYDINFNVKPGQNQVQSTQIFTLREGKLGAYVGSQGTTNIGQVSNPDNIQDTEEGSYSVTVQNPTDGGAAGAQMSSSMTFINSYQKNGSNMAFGSVTAVTTNESGYFMIEFTENSTNAAAGAGYRVKFISAENGEEGQWLDFTSVNGKLQGSYNSNGFNLNFEIPMLAGADTVNDGDKFLFSVTDSKGVANDDNLMANGGGALQISHNGVQGPVIVYNQPDSLTKPDDKDGIVDYNNVTVHTVTLDSKTGTFNAGEITLGFKENTGAAANGQTLSGTATIEVRKGGKAATSTTKLSELANFVDENGVELFAVTQELKIYGNNKNTTIYLEGDDTIQDVVDKITKAITQDLDMGSGLTEVDKKLISFNQTESTGFGVVPGTMILQSALTGKDGELSFIGSQKLMDALGLEVVQESSQNIQTITAKDNLTGVISGERVTSNSRVTDVIHGVDLIVDTRTGVDAYYNTGTGKIDFKPSSRLENQNLNLHIVDARTEIQIGTEKGEKLDVSLPALNTAALGIGNTNINTQDDAQRAITEIDNALTKVVSTRAKIGAYINRLNSTINTLATAEENTTSSESRIRDTDIARETTAMTTAQVAYQANIAILAQANQIPAIALSLLQA